SRSSTPAVEIAFQLGKAASDRPKPGKITHVIHLERTMKRFSLVCLAVTALVSNAALANADLAKAKNCVACHAVASKVIGPAFKDVAAKYAGQKGAEDKLTQKVLKGGSGVWGQVPMPANTQVSEAEARTLVKWVLSQK